MISLHDYITEGLLLERNERIFRGKADDGNNVIILVGDHGRERQDERGVTNGRIINILMTAYKDIAKMYAKGEIDQYEDHTTGTDITIADCRKNRQNPTCVTMLIRWNKSSEKVLKHPTFIVKTVFSKTDPDPNAPSYAALLRGEKTSRNEKLIWLY